MGRMSTSYRYVIDITGPDPISLGELGGGEFRVLWQVRE